MPRNPALWCSAPGCTAATPCGTCAGIIADAQLAASIRREGAAQARDMAGPPPEPTRAAVEKLWADTVAVRNPLAQLCRKALEGDPDAWQRVTWILAGHPDPGPTERTP